MSCRSKYCNPISCKTMIKFVVFLMLFLSLSSLNANAAALSPSSSPNEMGDSVTTTPSTSSIANTDVRTPKPSTHPEPRNNWHRRYHCACVKYDCPGAGDHSRKCICKRKVCRKPRSLKRPVSRIDVNAAHSTTRASSTPQGANTATVAPKRSTNPEQRSNWHRRYHCACVKYNCPDVGDHSRKCICKRKACSKPRSRKSPVSRIDVEPAQSGRRASSTPPVASTATMAPQAVKKPGMA